MTQVGSDQIDDKIGVLCQPRAHRPLLILHIVSVKTLKHHQTTLQICCHIPYSIPEYRTNIGAMEWTSRNYQMSSAIIKTFARDPSFLTI